MTLTKAILSYFLLSSSIFSFAELIPVNESTLGNVSGQAGISLDSTVDLTIGNISYQQRPTDSYFMLNDITARYSYVGATIDVTAQGALRFGLPETLHIDELSFGLYNSRTAEIDITNPNDIQTYTIYADTLGNAYDGFDLDISGISFDNGSNRLSGDYANSSNLAGNKNTQLTITGKTDIQLTLTSEDDCSSFFCDNAEDYAHIVIVDEDGNIVTEAGQSGTNNTRLNYSFESPINNHFIMNATLTGTFKMGGAIEMFGAGNVAFKR